MNLSSTLITIFEQKLADSASWPKLSQICAEYIKTRLEQKDYRFEPKSHITDACIRKYLLKVPAHTDPALHRLFREWQPKYVLEEEDELDELKKAFE